MKCLFWISAWIWLCLLSLLVWGCGTKVMVPPEVDLKQYESVGLVSFSSNVKGNLGEVITRKFLQRISQSQKGARIIELGSEDVVLKAVQQDKIVPETIQAIGQKFNVKAVIIGNVEVSKVRPRVSISSVLTSMSVNADVEASMMVKLIETERGATIWTDSAQDKRTVAHVSIFSGKDAYFDAKDPEEAYGDLAEALVGKVTVDLRSKYKRKM